MASPHTAGLLAYLLSIYPSPQFNPTFDKDHNLISMTSPILAQSTFLSSTQVYAVAHAVLPSWAAALFPAPAAVAPIPNPKIITPLQLKKALIDLSSKGLLTDLPPKTVNLLIFNNATRS